MTQATTRKPFPFLELPYDTQREVLSYLTLSDLGHLAQTGQEMRKKCTENFSTMKAEVWTKQLEISQPELFKLMTSLGGDHGKLYYDSYRLAYYKPGKWKWKYLNAAQNLACISAWCGGIFGIISSYNVAISPNIVFKPGFTFWGYTPTINQLKGVGVVGFVTSISVTGYLVYKLLSMPGYTDPYIKNKTRKESHGNTTTIYHYPDYFVRWKILWFDFSSFTDEPHCLKRLAYFGELQPKAYGAIKVLITATQIWQSAAEKSDPKRGKKIKNLLIATKEHQDYLNLLTQNDQETYIKIISFYKTTLAKDGRNHSFLQLDNSSRFPVSPPNESMLTWS